MKTFLERFPKIFTKKTFLLLGGILAVWIGIIHFSGNIDSIDGEAPKDLKYFVSDGCSMFPDGDYRDCCVEHDKAYFFGGTWEQRLAADNAFLDCISQKGGFHQALGPTMWLGVRFGGAPLFPTHFRWGFGRDQH